MSSNLQIESTKQIIVSGATGFIGQHLIPLLLKKNHEVIAIGRNEKKAKSFPWYSHVKFIASDIHKDSLSFRPKKGATLIHLAWQGLPNYNSLFHFEENLPKSYDFIKTLLSKGVESVLVTGTCFEYGFQSGPLDANTRTKPANPYALAKDTLRQYLNHLKQEQPFSLKWARLFYIYGEGQNPKSICALLDKAIENNEKTFNMSGGEQLRDYLPIQSVTQKLIDILEQQTEGIFNVCSGKPISIRKLVEERIKDKNASIQLNLGYYPYPDYEPMAFWGAQKMEKTDERSQ